MTDDPKTPGQIAYEAFNTAPAFKWEQIETRHAAWEAVAAAVLSQPHRGTIHGPVEMRDYDYITLAVPHRLEYPADALGFPTRLPAGTRLHMLEPKPGALGVSYEKGAACKAGDWPRPDSDESKARMADLVAQAKATTPDPFADLYNAAVAHIRRTRKWVREAEEMAPREAAQMLDRLAATLDQARKKFEQGDAAGAMAVFAEEDEENDDE